MFEPPRPLAEIDADLTQTTDRILAMIGGTGSVKPRPYPAYRESGIEWVGAIPNVWEVWPLKRVEAVTNGLGQPPEYCDDGTSFIRATNVKRIVWSNEGLVYVNEASLPASRVTRLKCGDIVVVRSGAYTGDSALVTDEWTDAIAGFDMVVRCHTVVNYRFLAMSLLANYVLEAQQTLCECGWHSPTSTPKN